MPAATHHTPTLCGDTRRRLDDGSREYRTADGPWCSRAISHLLWFAGCALGTTVPCCTPHQPHLTRPALTRTAWRANTGIPSSSLGLLHTPLHALQYSGLPAHSQWHGPAPPLCSLVGPSSFPRHYHTPTTPLHALHHTPQVLLCLFHLTAPLTPRLPAPLRALPTTLPLYSTAPCQLSFHIRISTRLSASSSCLPVTRHVLRTRDTYFRWRTADSGG